jgi:hypothetical protein
MLQQLVFSKKPQKEEQLQVGIIQLLSKRKQKKAGLLSGDAFLTVKNKL